MDNEKMTQALRIISSSFDEERTNDPCLKRYHELPAYPLDVVRDGSDPYIKALTDAIFATAKGEYGSIDYKGYKIYYTDTPHIASISLEDGHKEYSYEISFRCDALSFFSYEEYHSEDERIAFLDPENDLFKKTIALLDKVIGNLDDGKWINEKKKLNIYDFKDYSYDGLSFKRIEWDERNKNASAESKRQISACTHRGRF